MNPVANPDRKQFVRQPNPESKISNKIPVSWQEESLPKEVEPEFIETESLFHIATKGWLEPDFYKSTHWVFRLANSGMLFILCFLFVCAQVIVLNDMAYEGAVQDYFCEDEKVGELISVAFLPLFVVLYCTQEEQRNFIQLIILQRNEPFRIAGFIAHREWRAALPCVMASFRTYGVLSMVYVAAGEQILLADSVSNYVLNSVAVCFVVDLDALLRFAGTTNGTEEEHVKKRVKIKLTSEESALLNHTHFYQTIFLPLVLIVPLLVSKITGEGCANGHDVRVSDWIYWLVVGSRLLLQIHMVVVSATINVDEAAAKKYIIEKSDSEIELENEELNQLEAGPETKDCSTSAPQQDEHHQDGSYVTWKYRDHGFSKPVVIFIAILSQFLECSVFVCAHQFFLDDYL